MEAVCGGSMWRHASYEVGQELRSSALGACSVRRYREIWGYGSKVLIVCLNQALEIASLRRPGGPPMLFRSWNFLPRLVRASWLDYKNLTLVGQGLDRRDVKTTPS
jgi:hypothetical protein